MPTTSQQISASQKSLALKKDFDRALLAIDQAFARTMAEMESIHQQKIALLNIYKKKLEDLELKKIRKEINKTT